MRRGFGIHDKHSPFRFNPAALFSGGVQGAWYDPSDLSTLFQDAAGTIPVAAIGDPVGRILDKSGNENHATQSSDASRPLLQQSDGLYHLTFDGSNDSLSTGNVNLNSNDKITVFAGVRKNVASGRGMLLELSASGANSGAFNISAPEATNDYAFSLTGNVGSEYYQPTGYAAFTNNVLSCVYDFSGALLANEVAPRINGAFAQFNGVGTAAGTNPGFLNAPLYIGRRNNTNLPFNGRLYGLIVINAAATSWLIAAAERWMAQRTGITF